MLKECKHVSIPIETLSDDAVVTGSARLQDFDGYYTGLRFDKYHEFKDIRLVDLRKELETIERVRKDENVRVTELVFTKVVLPR